MVNEVESTFMNNLPFSLRPVATELYNMHLLKELLEIRQGKIPVVLSRKYNMSKDQWVEISNVVILTKLSQFTLSKELKLEHIEHLEQVLCTVLEMKNASCDEINQAIRYYEASVLADWYERLQKLHAHKRR